MAVSPKLPDKLQVEVLRANLAVARVIQQVAAHDVALAGALFGIDSGLAAQFANALSDAVDDLGASPQPIFGLLNHQAIARHLGALDLGLPPESAESYRLGIAIGAIRPAQDLREDGA